MPLMVGHVVITQFATSSALIIAVVSRLPELRKHRVIENINLAGVAPCKNSLIAVVRRLREMRKHHRVIGDINLAGVHSWKGSWNEASLVDPS